MTGQLRYHEKKREKIREIPKQYFEDNKGSVPKMNGDRYRGLYEEEDRLKRGYDRKQYWNMSEENNPKIMT